MTDHATHSTAFGSGAGAARVATAATPIVPAMPWVSPFTAVLGGNRKNLRPRRTSVSLT